MARNNVTVIPVNSKTGDLRGMIGSVFHAATDGQISNYERNLAAGIPEDRCVEILVDEIARSLPALRRMNDIDQRAKILPT